MIKDFSLKHDKINEAKEICSAVKEHLNQFVSTFLISDKMILQN